MGLERAVAAMGFKAIGAAKFRVFGLRSKIINELKESWVYTFKVSGERFDKAVRFIELASGARADVRALLKSGTLDITKKKLTKFYII